MARRNVSVFVHSLASPGQILQSLSAGETWNWGKRPGRCVLRSAWERACHERGRDKGVARSSLAPAGGVVPSVYASPFFDLIKSMRNHGDNGSRTNPRDGALGREECFFLALMEVSEGGSRKIKEIKSKGKKNLAKHRRTKGESGTTS